MDIQSIAEELAEVVTPLTQQARQDVKTKKLEISDYEQALERYTKKLAKLETKLAESRSKDSYKNLLRDPKRSPKGSTKLRIEIEECKDHLDDIEAIIADAKRDLRILRDDMNVAVFDAIHGPSGLRKKFSLKKLELEDQVKLIEQNFLTACNEYKKEMGFSRYHPDGPTDPYYLGLRTELENPVNQEVFTPQPVNDGSHITPLAEPSLLTGPVNLDVNKIGPEGSKYLEGV